jgi:CheY-like chemotaxis protein
MVTKDPQTRTPKRVLVIDDELTTTELLQELLEKEGYEAVTASDGREGLEHLEEAEEAFDLVLCDVMMPFMSGVQLCRTIQQSSAAYRDIPVVLMSAAGLPAPGSGCNYASFISKPFDLDSMLKVLAHLTLP